MAKAEVKQTVTLSENIVGFDADRKYARIESTVADDGARYLIVYTGLPGADFEATNEANRAYIDAAGVDLLIAKLTEARNSHFTAA